MFTMVRKLNAKEGMDDIDSWLVGQSLRFAAEITDHFKDVPKTVADLKDDPFRSLAGELRRAGGYAKDTTPFSEFLWADFLRQRIKRKSIDKDYAAALKRAVRLAKSDDAAFLPGWCGADPIA